MDNLATVASGESREMDEDIVLPFEVDMEGSGDLLSLSEEMNHLLDPRNQLRTPPPLIDLSPLECHALQMEEVTTLTAIYGNDLQPLNDSGTCFLVNVKFLSEEIKEEDVIRIWFSLPASYPCVPPVFEIEANSSGSFSYTDADDLFDLLMKESIKRVGNMMIFDLVTIAQEYMPDLIECKHVNEKKRVLEEKERREILELEEVFSDNKKTTTQQMWPGDDLSPMREDESEEEEVGGEEGAWSISSSKMKRRPAGKDNDVVFQPAQFVGSISNILKKFPDGLQIQRIENILRQDLARKFYDCQQSMTSTLTDRERKNPLMYNLKTQVAFHGTLTRSLPSIVQHGLVIPGAGNRVKVRCGSSLGVGIYLSPSPDYSLSYTDSKRLLICATLQGRIYNYGSIKTDKHHSRFNCLVCGEEWVFFNAAQVLPCYVVEVREGDKKNSKQSNPPPLSSLLDSHQSSSNDETVEQRRLRLTARAKKFLPYGYGPGTKTVILDVASVDEDEEDYGDYQLLRTSIVSDDEKIIMKQQSGVVKETSALQEYRHTDTAKSSVTDIT